MKDFSDFVFGVSHTKSFSLVDSLLSIASFVGSSDSSIATSTICFIDSFWSSSCVLSGTLDFNFFFFRDLSLLRFGSSVFVIVGGFPPYPLLPDELLPLKTDLEL